MQVSVENTSAIEKRVTIQVPALEVKEQIDARLREIGKQVNLKGFRPGRVPFSVLSQRYGPQATEEVIQSTAMDKLIRVSCRYSEAWNYLNSIEAGQNGEALTLKSRNLVR